MKLTNNRGSAFFALILAMLIFGGMGLTTVSLMANNVIGSSDNFEGSQAFYVAEGGIQHTVMNQLLGDTDFTDNVSPTGTPLGVSSISLNPGEFWVEYLNATVSSVDVRVTARVDNTVRVIKQTVTSAYEYSSLSAGNLDASNTTGTFTGHLGIEGNYTLDPDLTINGSVFQQTNLSLPTIDASVYLAMTTSTYTGTYTFSSDYTGNLYVTGNVNFDDNVTFNGVLYIGGNVLNVGNNVTINGTLVAEGNINISGNNFTITAQQIDDDEHMPAIVGLNNVNFSGSVNTQIYGLVWTSKNIDFSNTVDLNYTGSLIADKNITFTNATNMTIIFDTSLMEGIPGMQGLDQTVKTVALSNWKFD